MTDRQKDRRKTVSWWISIIVFLLLAVPALILFFLASRPGEALLRRTVEGRLAESLDRPVRIGRLSTNLLSRLRLEDVWIGPRQEKPDELAGSQPAMAFGSATAGYSLLPLLRGRLQIDSLRLEDLALSVEQLQPLQPPPPGGVNPADLPPPGSPIPEPPAPIFPTSIRISRIEVEAARLLWSGRDLLLDRADIGPVTWETNSASLGSLALSLYGLQIDGHAAFHRAGERFPLEGRLQLRGDPRPLLDALRLPWSDRITTGGEIQAAVELAGDLADPQADLRGELPPAVVNGFSLSGGTLQAHWRERALELKLLELRAPEGSLRASGTLQPEPWRFGGLQARIERLALAPLWQAVYGERSPFQGVLEGSLSASGPLSAFGEGGLGVAEAEAGAEPVQKPKASAKQRREAPLQDGEVPAEPGVRVPTEGREIAEAGAKGTDARVPAEPGRAEAGALQAELEIELGGLQYRGSPVADISARLSYRSGTVEGIVRQEESRVSFQAALDPQTLEGRFDARVERIEPLAALLRVYGLSGRLQASGTLRGPWGAPVVQASLSGRNIRYQGFPADTLEARVSVREGRVVFSRLEAAGSLSAIDPAHPPLELKGWSGGFRYSGSLQGPTDALTGRISATLLEPGYAGVRFDRGGLEARLQGDRLLLDTIVLDRGSLRIAARGWLGTRPLGGALDLQVSRRSGGSPTPTGRLSASFAMQDNRRFTLQADGEGILLDLLQSLEAGLPDVGGALTFSVSAGGSLDDPRGEARVQVADPRFREVRMGSLSGRARLEEDGLRVEEVELQGEGAHFRASARLGLDLRPGRTALSGASPFSGEIEGQNVNLRILAPFLPPELRVEGSLSSRIAWSGTLGAPDPAGSLALSGGMVRLAPETPPVQGIELSATIRERALVLDRLNAAILEIPISLQGELRTPDWKEVRLNLTASIAGRAALEVAGSVSPDAIHLDSQVREINLQLASAVLPSLSKLGGTLNGTLSVRGKPADPQINGTVEARDVSMLLPGFPEPLSNGEIGLSFEGRRVTVQTLTARLGQGMVSLSGSFGYRAGGLESADLKAAARGMKLEKKGLYRLVIQSADLVYRGRGEQYVLEGDVVPGDSRLLQNFQPQAILAFLRSAERPAPQLPLFLEKTRLNIRLRGADNLWVQNNLGRVRIQAAVNVIGTPTRPVVTGRVSVEEGYVIFLDRRFTITHGIADFQDTRRLNPYIDLKARADVKYFQNLLSTQFAIVLSLRGPLDTLEVALSSDPPLNRSNILSLLALGTIRPGDDEGGRIDERSTGEIVIQRAGELASQQISEYVGKGVEDLLGLDQFSVTGNLFDIGGQNNPEIVASKRVNDRLELTYSTNIGPFDEHNLEMDYKLTDNLALQGRLNQEGEAEVRLKFGIKLK